MRDCVALTRGPLPGPVNQRCAIAERRITHDASRLWGSWKPRFHAAFEWLSLAAVRGGTVTYAGFACTYLM